MKTTTKDDGSGLSLLTILYCELLASTPAMSKELGPKGYLPLLSRLSFSDMYSDLEANEKEKFSQIMEKYSNEKGQKFLFPKAYSLNLGPVNLLDSVLTKECMKDVLQKIKKVTFDDFIKSIQKPHGDFVLENNQIFSNSLKCLLDSERKPEFPMK